MTKSDLVRDMKQTTGSSFITVSELTRYLGKQNQSRVKQKYLKDLDRVGKGYFIPDVAQTIMDDRNWAE